MKAIPIANYPQEIANAFLNGIAFVNEVRTVDKNQLDILMKNACFHGVQQRRNFVDCR
ncbi:MAG: hypothetical protein R3E67_03415 [Pseudomonadales bacterium]